MVELLLSAPKIILNIKSSENKTPLDIATKLYNEATNSEKKRIYADIQRLLTKKRAKTFFYLDKIALWEKNRKNIVKNF